MDNIKLIQQIVKAEIGLDENALGIEVIRSAVNNRLKATACSNEYAYLDTLKVDFEEREALCQLLLVSESWMLRETVTLDAGKQYLQEIREANPGAVVRLLSAPCARGEEVVSLLHTALEAGFSLSQIEIVGIDLSQGALNLAQAGIFGEGSFRNTDPLFVQKYFVSQKNRYRLRSEFLERMSFKRVNLLDNLLEQLGGMFSLILCRNVLIYLGQQERERVILNLKELLPLGGFLGVGAAESSLIKAGSLNRRQNSISSVFFNESPISQKVRKQNTKRRPVELKVNAQLPKSEPLKISPSATKVVPKVEPKQAATLEQAFALADSGKHADAQETCFILIDQDPLQAEAYYLLGLIAIAQNDTSLSNAYFKRVLYLNPQHEEAKLQLGSQKRSVQGQTTFGAKRL